MNIHEVRFKNLLEAIKMAGNQAKLADLIGVKSAYISQIKNPKHKTNMGNDVASRIENALNLPHGWMDQRHDGEAVNNSPQQQAQGDAQSVLQARFNQAPKSVQKLILEILEGAETTSIDQDITHSLMTLIKAAKKQNIQGKDLETGTGELYEG